MKHERMIDPGIPTIKIFHPDGTFGNYLKVNAPPVNKKYLERVSGMKFNRRNIIEQIAGMLTVIGQKYDNEALFNEVITTADGLIIDYYSKRKNNVLFYDVDCDENVLFGTFDSKVLYPSTMRITRMTRAALYGQDLDTIDCGSWATIDNESLLANLTYEMEQAAKLEDYEQAAYYRNFMSSLKTDKKK